MAGARHNSSWLNDLGLPHVVYQDTDEKADYYFPPVAHEAAAYVQYIVDHLQVLAWLLCCGAVQAAVVECKLLWCRECSCGAWSC